MTNQICSIEWKKSTQSMAMFGLLTSTKYSIDGSFFYYYLYDAFYDILVFCWHSKAFSMDNAGGEN